MAEIPTRKALAAARAEAVRLLAKIVELKAASAHDPYIGFDLSVAESYKDAISQAESELSVVRNQEDQYLGDIRAEDAERALEEERAKTRIGHWMLLLGLLLTAANVIYNFLKH